MRTKTLTTLSLMTLVLGAIVYAQSFAKPMIQASIPFSFTAGQVALPAGQYDFIPSEDKSAIRVQSTDRKSVATLMVITRLAAGIHTTPEDAHIVFDKIGNSYFLSELWLPNDDGISVRSTKEAHTHQIVNVPK